MLKLASNETGPSWIPRSLTLITTHPWTGTMNSIGADVLESPRTIRSDEYVMFA
jgi:hypothetical protein